MTRPSRVYDNTISSSSSSSHSSNCYQMQNSKSLGSGVGVGGGTPITGVGLAPRMMTGENQNGATGAKKKKMKLPSPKEMVAHYESKGMQPQEASLKVIDDLQNLLFRIVTNNKKSTMNTEMDAINTRLLRLEAKLDSKPGYPQTLAIGVVSGAVFRVIPHVAASVSNIWNSVRASTSSSSTT